MRRGGVTQWYGGRRKHLERFLGYKENTMPNALTNVLWGEEGAVKGFFDSLGIINRVREE